MNQLDQKLHDKLADYVQDAHTLEKAIVKNLDSMRGTLEDPTLDGLLERHRKVIRTHVQRLELRLEDLGRGSSVRKQLEGLAAELMKSVSDVLRTDASGKVGRDAYVMAQTEVAAYELLRRLAAEAGDAETKDVAELHLKESRAFADEVAEHWDDFLRLTVQGWVLDESDTSVTPEEVERADESFAAQSTV
jgi:ferritin-like metal-binding protein YciE